MERALFVRLERERSARRFRRLEDVDWDCWVPDERATLLFVVRGGEILLMHKKRGLGAGKINGPGGRLEPGETPMDLFERLCVEPSHTTP